MSGVNWPHQTLPRDLGSIVDWQVHLWEMQQDHPSGASPEKGGKVASGAQVGSPQLGDQAHPVRYPWLHYWGDVIVAELTRLNQTDEHAEAFLNEGMNEHASNEPRQDQHRLTWTARRAASHAQSKRSPDKP